MNKILVTGAAGFIGFHLCKELIKQDYTVVGLDNINDYYDTNLKVSRLKQIEDFHNFKFVKLNIAERESLSEIFSGEQFDVVVHLAAQPGVRYSLVNPYAYVESNISGFLNILEGCRNHHIEHLVYASSSSIYGANTKMPFSVHQNVDHPVSLYAATKKSNELMAHAYSHLYGIPITGLRFFTVYGPWGRPDMAYYSFTRAIFEDKPMDVFNYGRMKRDFTYIDDIVDGVMRVLPKIPVPNPKWNGADPDPGTSYAPYRLYNIGNNNPVELMFVINILEQCIGKKAKMNMLPMQSGDVTATFADIDDLRDDVGFEPSTPIEKGLGNFVDWYKSYHL
ncbi:MAG: capsular biosynthesis protein CpsI [Spirochaetae bacterium HGW-Spirochaetae-5]|nr:MAG: capsular biosynthesis protein CpsI [Spirochaetae bacterium HGW-Spirochaetae-5]